MGTVPRTRVPNGESRPKGFRHVVMFEKRKFVQNPLTTNALLLLLFVLPLNVVGVWVVRREPYQVTAYLLLAAAIFSFFQVTRASRFKTVACDSEGFEVTTRTLLGTSPTYERLRWSDVTETKFVSVDRRREYHFAVVVNGVERRLLDRGQSSKRHFNGLVAFANEATPHLPYEWVLPDDERHTYTFKQVSRRDGRDG
jgi:hypothetical protein